MPSRRLPKSLRKFLRRKKAEIRRQFLSLEEAEARIRELVSRVYQGYDGVVSKEAKVTKGTEVTKAQ